MEAEASFTMTVQQPTGPIVSIGVIFDTLRAWIQTKDLDGGDARLSKHVSQMITDIVGDKGNLRVTFYVRDSRKDPRVVGMVVDLSEEDIYKFRMPGAKYISLLIEDTSVPSRIWRISKLSLVGTTGGGRR